jgi:hypothetical protein
MLSYIRLADGTMFDEVLVRGLRLLKLAPIGE